MAGYSYLSQVQDRAAQAALKAAFDQINALQTQLTQLQAQMLAKSASGIDCGSQRLTNVAPPTSDSDAVTVAVVRQLIRAEVETF